MRSCYISRFFAGFLTLGLLAMPGALAQSKPQALRVRPAAPPAPDYLYERAVKRVAAVEFDRALFTPAAAKRTANALAALRKGQASDAAAMRVEMNLFADRSLTIRWVDIERTDAADGFVWHGAVEDAPLGSAVMVVSDDGRVQANFARGDGTMWQIRTLDDGSTWVREVNQREFPLELPPIRDYESTVVLPAAEKTALDASTPSPSLDDGSTVDVMVLFTPTARSRAGGAQAMLQLVQLGIAETNQGYANSGVTHRVRLVHSAEVAYTETGDMLRDLNALSNPSDGIIDNIHPLRNQYAADLVSLWVEGGDYCGLAWMMPSTTGNADRGFSIVGRSCATGYYSFGHEMGHNMGATHGVDDNTGPGLFPYSYAFKAPGQFRTIMAYDDNCSCNRINYWSNPSVRVNSVAIGRDPNGANPAANFLTLNNTRVAVSRYRDSAGGGGGTPPPPPPPGGSGAFPESAHPYANDFDNTWTYSINGAAALNVTFDQRTSVEPGFDFISVLDGQGNHISGSPFTGTTLANRTVTVQGNTVRIRLQTDSSVTDYGFRVTSITATGGAAALPRLVVTSVTAPASGQLGAQIAVRAEFTNQGNAAAGAFRVGFYWSTDRTITTGDTPGATCNITSLAAGANNACAGNITIPLSLTPGTWYLGAIVDDENRVNQSSRAGNAGVAANAIQITGSVPAEITSPPPSSQLTTTSVTFAWNAGVGVTSYTLQVGRSATDSSFFNRNLGTARTVTVTGLPTDGSTLFVRLVSRIGSTDQTRSYNYRAPLLGGGNSQPRIVISSFTAPTSGSLGVNLQGAAMAIANQGSAPTGPFRVGFYFGRTRDVTTRDVFTGWFCNYPEGLAAGAATTCSGEIGVPTTLTQGVWFLAAIADDQNRVNQSDRSGNIRVNDNGGTDLGGVAAAEMQTPPDGSTLTSASQTFRWNSGSGGEQFVLALGTTAGGDDIASVDASSNLSTTVNNLPTNGRQIFARLYTRIGGDWYYNDYSYRAANIAAAQARLVVTSFTAPRTGTVGVNLQGISVAVQNQGNGNAPPFQIGFYYGRSATVTTSDVASGWSCNVANGLAAGQTFTCTGEIGVPAAITAGTWFAAAIADDRNQVPQSTRAGNVRVNDNGPTVFTGSGGGGGGAALPESAHPYTDNLDQTWNYTVPGNPSQIRVTFDPRTSVETGWDFLYVFDHAGNQVSGSPFTGNQLAGRTLTMAGPSFRIRFTTDGSVVDWGFRVTGAEAVSTGGGGTLPESAHPYTDNLDQTWNYTVPGNPPQIRVTFDSRTSVEQAFDFIYVFDNAGNQVPGSPFTGNQLAGRTLTMAGPSFRIRFTTDGSVVDWGFRVTSAEAVATSGPRLNVTTFTAPVAATIGNQLGPVRVTIRNDGDLRATAFRTAFFWSPTRDVVQDRSVFSGFFCNSPNGLNPGESTTCTGNIEVTSEIRPGVWFLAAIADDRGQLTQTSRADNIRVNENGSTTVVAGGLVYPESDHPYQNNMDRTWSFTQPGNPVQIRVTFDPQTSFEEGWDFLYIRDSRGVQIAGSPFTGRQLAGRTVTVPGPTINLGLVTDDSVVDWGFRITNVTAGTPDLLPGLSLSPKSRAQAGESVLVREGEPAAFDLNSGAPSPQPDLKLKPAATAPPDLSRAQPAPPLPRVFADPGPPQPNRTQKQ
jgi:hypothetical protein